MQGITLHVRTNGDLRAIGRVFDGIANDILQRSIDQLSLDLRNKCLCFLVGYLDCARLSLEYRISHDGIQKINDIQRLPLQALRLVR